MTNNITVQKQGDRFVAKFPWSVESKDLVKAAGFRFDGTSKLWWTRDPSIAAKLAQPDLAARLTQEAQAKRDAAARTIAQSQATDAALDVPAPAGLSYLPYQRAGIAYAQQRPATLIGDEMGLGKTIQAIGVINADPSITKVLVVSPASLKLNWRNELAKWLTRPLAITIVNGASFPASGVAIINYDILAKHRAQIDVFAPDLLVVDECHTLKNPKAQRTALVLGKYDRDESKRMKAIPAKRRIFLTGTPIVNRPIELWPLVHALDPQGLGRSWRYFVTRYCAGYQGQHGWDVSGASHLDELQQRLRASIMVRRLKKDVLTELPAKRRQIVVLPTNGAADAVAREQQGYAQATRAVKQARVRAELAKASDDPDEYAAAVKALRDEASAAFTEIAKLRHDTAVAKIPAVIEHLTEALEAGGKVVLMAHHHDVVHALAEAFPSAAVVTGEVAVDKRQSEVERFQSDPDCRLFIGSIRAAGVGLTLTAASHVVFAELDWTPGSVSQAEDRCHRIGQHDNVLVQHLVLDGSLDARMAQIIVDKQQVIDAALDDAAGPLPDAPVFADPPATADVTPARIASDAAALPPARATAILQGLRMLAGVCDGAVALDNVGFNKIDTGIGHALAACSTLTPRQAALGARLLKKYHRQLPADVLAAAA